MRPADGADAPTSRRIPPAQTGQRAGGQAPQTGQAGPQTGQVNAPAGQPSTMAQPAPANGGVPISRGGAIIHEVGTVRMGDDPRTSPLNKYCQAHEVKNLFVADAAPFVSNADKNPTAHHRGAGLAHRRVPGRRTEEGQCLTMSRRDALRRLGLVLMATGALDRVAAQEVHDLVIGEAQAGAGPSTPKSFTPAEFQTLERLTDLIIPVENGAPGAVAAGCAAWIDLISSENDQLKKIYKSGFAWVDAAMKTARRRQLRRRHARPADGAARPDRLPPQPVARARPRD